MVRCRCRTVGWPENVPWPAGPKPYDAIGRGETARILQDSLTAPDGQDIQIVAWTEGMHKMRSSSHMYADNLT